MRNAETFTTADAFSTMRLTNRRALAEATYPTRESRFRMALAGLNPEECLEFTVSSDREYRAMHAGFGYAAKALGVKIEMRKRGTSFLVALAPDQDPVKLEV